MNTGHKKSASLSSLFPLTNGKHRLTARPKKKPKQKNELAHTESKDQLLIWLKEDVIRTKRVMRGSYPSSGQTSSDHTHSDTSFFPENPGEQLTSPAEVELSSDSLTQKTKQLHLHNIWVRTTGTERNGRPDTQTCGYPRHCMTSNQNILSARGSENVKTNVGEKDRKKIKTKDRIKASPCA